MLTAKRGRGARKFRRVVHSEVVQGPAGGDRYRLTLACGHVVERRMWVGRDAPRRVRCEWCKRKGVS